MLVVLSMIYALVLIASFSSFSFAFLFAKRVCSGFLISLLICSLNFANVKIFQVPEELLEEAKAAAKAALEEMDAD